MLALSQLSEILRVNETARASLLPSLLVWTTKVNMATWGALDGGGGVPMSHVDFKKQ